MVTVQLVARRSCSMLFILLLVVFSVSCHVSSVSGPATTWPGQPVELVVHYVTTSGGNTATAYVIADVPIEWTPLESTYSGVASGVPVSGVCAVTETQPPGIGGGIDPPAAGFKRRYFSAGPFNSVSYDDSGDAHLRFVVGGDTGPLVLSFWGAGSTSSGSRGDYLSTTKAITVAAAPNGDVDGDGTVTVQDVFYLINTLFASGPPPAGPADVNGDHLIDITDIFYLINFLFAGGPAPI